jgi:hydrogenase maturation factor HypF (carbamoyltransferase family)
MMQTWHIHIRGQVQGVGFRPFIFKQAQQFKLRVGEECHRQQADVAGKQLPRMF